MQVILHQGEEVSSGSSPLFCEPNLSIRTLLINITSLSLGELGSISFKIQHSYDGTTWNDIPNLVTSSITNTGTTTVSLNSSFPAADNLRCVWTAINLNAVTFTLVVTGAK